MSLEPLKDTSEMSELDDLHELDWIAVPNEDYVMKYMFHNVGYCIMLSNLTSLYFEKLTETHIMERFCKLNSFAQMKLKVILENLKCTLQRHLTEKTGLNLRFDSDRLIISLQFPSKHVLCNYDIEMDLMGADKVTKYIIGPTILSALLNQRKVMELQKKMSSEIKSSVSSNVTIPSQNLMDPDLLKGQNVPLKTLLDSFLEIQSQFKDLYAKNYEAYCAIAKEKLKNKSLIQYVSPNKKLKNQENFEDETTNIHFEDGNEKISIKEEAEFNFNTASQSERNIVKKKKLFKI